MGARKYKVGDRVLIKPITWYLKYKNEYNEVELPGHNMLEDMQRYCGCVMTVFDIGPDFYRMVEDSRQYCWTPSMIEGLAKGFPTVKTAVFSEEPDCKPFYSNSEKRILDSVETIKECIAGFNYNNDRCNLGICEEMLNKLDIELAVIKECSKILREGIESTIHKNKR